VSSEGPYTSVNKLWRWQLRRDTSRAGAGIVTLMFTDLVSSSELIEALGDDASNRITGAHLRLLREIVASYDGQEVKSLGDGLMIVFPSAVKALSCAIAMQRAVHEKNRRVGADLEIRVGLHAGEPVRNKDDYFGRPVVIAKRLCDSAYPGQIVASDLVENIVGSRGAFKFLDLGLVTLKGISIPVEAREVVWSGEEAGLSESFDEFEPPRKVRTSAMIALLAAVAAVGTIVAVIVRDDDRATPSGATAGRTPQGSASNTSIAPGGDGWIQLDDPDHARLGGPGKQAITRIATDGNRLVAVGLERFGSDIDAAVWVANDPRSWRRIDPPGVFDGPGKQTIWGVAMTDEVVVAVGYEDDGTGTDAAVWISEGQRWRRVEDQPDLTGIGDQTMNRVIEYRDGFLAVGWDSSGGDVDAAVWTSPDGHRWTRVAADDDVFGGEGDQRMFGVAAGPNLIVAVGEDSSRSTSPGGVDGAVWNSKHGIRWKRIPAESSNFKVRGDGSIRAIEDVGQGFVAVGSSIGYSKRDAASWHSEDGHYWDRTSSVEEQLGGRRNQEMWSVVLAGDLLYAVGYDKAGGGPDAAAWTSADSGESWTREAPSEEIFGGDREQAMKGVVVFKSWVVAGGWDEADAGPNAQIWYKSLTQGD
jgi:class 3 adenylate cyclase